MGGRGSYEEIQEHRIKCEIEGELQLSNLHQERYERNYKNKTEGQVSYKSKILYDVVEKDKKEKERSMVVGMEKKKMLEKRLSYAKLAMDLHKP